MAEEQIKHCNNCVFIGIYHCWHPDTDMYAKQKSFSDEEGKDCSYWKEGGLRPILMEGYSNCSRCNKSVPLDELTNAGKGISYCKECI
jgi:hypothetical protein